MYLASDGFSLHQPTHACPVSAKMLKTCGKKPRPWPVADSGVQVAGAEIAPQVKFRTAEEVAGLSKMQSAQLNCDGFRDLTD